MNTFVVTYTFSAKPAEVDQIRPTHRVWLKDQLDSGSLLASGPMVDRAAALLVFRAETIEELIALLDQDPYEITGIIGERTVEQWNPIFGPFSS
jgi:uncharacterized protein YciI